MSFWLKFTVTVNFLLLMLKCLKFNCFMLQSQKIKCLVLSRCPHSDPHINQCLIRKYSIAKWNYLCRCLRKKYFSFSSLLAEVCLNGFELWLACQNKYKYKNLADNQQTRDLGIR